MKTALIGSEGNLGKLVSDHLDIDYCFDIYNKPDYFNTNDIDTVIHFGEYSDPTISVDKSLKNLNSTLEYINHAKKNGVKRFFYASSHRIKGSWEFDLNLTSTKYFPITYYACSKIYIENFLRLESNDTFKVTILRIGTILGEDTESNSNLGKRLSERTGKYVLTRVLKKEFIDFMTLVLNSEQEEYYEIINLIPEESKLNQIFDGKNFSYYKNI